jgi:hypothetical protein
MFSPAAFTGSTDQALRDSEQAFPSFFDLSEVRARVGRVLAKLGSSVACIGQADGDVQAELMR